MPGYFPPGSTLEVALEYERKNGARTAFTTEWNPDRFSHQDSRVVAASGKGLFDPRQSLTIFVQNNDQLTKITAQAKDLEYSPSVGNLLTTVTVRYPNLPNVIRTRKLVIKQKVVAGRGAVAHYIEVDDHKETSGLFE